MATYSEKLDEVKAAYDSLKKLVGDLHQAAIDEKKAALVRVLPAALSALASLPRIIESAHADQAREDVAQKVNDDAQKADTVVEEFDHQISQFEADGGVVPSLPSVPAQGD